MPRAAAPTEVSSPLLAAWLTAAVGRSAAGSASATLAQLNDLESGLEPSVVF